MQSGLGLVGLCSRIQRDDLNRRKRGEVMTTGRRRGGAGVMRTVLWRLRSNNLSMIGI